MGYAEFPNLNHDAEDLHELIWYYKEVRDKYDGTLNEIKDLSARLDRYEQDVDSRISSAVEQAITEYKGIVDNTMKTEFAKMNQSINTRISEMIADIAEFKYEMEDRQSFHEQANRVAFEKFQLKVNTELREMNSSLTNYTRNTRDILTKSQKLFMHEILNEIEEIKGTLPMEYNGSRWLWDNTVPVNGMTCFEWYNYPQMTCESWNESKISCLDWYVNSVRLLQWDKHLEKLFSPITGEFVPLRSIVIELIERLKVNAITAGEYDSLELTAQRVDELRATAGEYDWIGDIIYKCSAVEQKRG